MVGDYSYLRPVKEPRPNTQMLDSAQPMPPKPISLRTGGVKRARQRGNAILEGALIFLPMLAFFFGIIDVSLGIFVQSTLTTATREGTRFAITYGSSFNGNSCASSQSSCVDQVVQYNAVGLPSGLAATYITVNYYTANDLANPVMACNNGTCSTAVCTVATCMLPQTLTNGTIVTTANQPGNIVEVVVAGYPWNWLVPMPGFSAGTGVTLGARSVDVLGGLAVGTSTPPTP
jgi:Flp pilus assembly protein TadG